MLNLLYIDGRPEALPRLGAKKPIATCAGSILMGAGYVSKRAERTFGMLDSAVESPRTRRRWITG